MTSLLAARASGTFTLQIEVAAAEEKTAQLEVVVEKLTVENKTLKDDVQYLQDSLSKATTQLALVKEEVSVAAGHGERLSTTKLLMGALLGAGVAIALQRKGISLAALIFGKAT